jgi:hypothetical protein
VSAGRVGVEWSIRGVIRRSGGRPHYPHAVSNVAHAFWPRWYRGIARFDPMLEPWWGRFGAGNVVRVTIPGRRTGEPRSLFLGILRAGGRRYLGHPDISCAWTDNLDAAGGGEIEWRDGSREAFTAELLGPGPERDAVIRATFTQHPFPGGVLYWLLRGNLRAVGRFYRLSEAPA